MIRINLLPVKAKQRQVTVVTQLVVGGVVVVGVALAMVIHYGLFQKRVENKYISENSQLTTEISNLQRLIGQVEQLEAKEAELNTKLDTIAQLKRNKVGPVRMLEELSVTIPKKLWLSSVKEETQSPFLHQVNLTGDATSNETIAEFMTKLEESKYFRNVSLVFSRRGTSTQGKMEVQNFEITAQLVFEDPKSESAMLTP